MSEFRYTFARFIKDWMLVIAMAVGAGSYLLYHFLPGPHHSAGPFLLDFCHVIQPLMLFVMLFLSFSKIEPQQMRPHKWMVWHLLIQVGLFIAFAALLILVPWCREHIFFEAAMLCLVCPTATACAVVTGKLGGNMAGVVTYTVLINLAVAIAVPLIVPLVHPASGISFLSAFYRILAKVFPLLIMPCLLAWLVRYLLPGVHSFIVGYAGASFYIWAFSLSLAILMSVRSLIASHASVWVVLEIAAGSLLACVFQFWIGRVIGAHYGCKISAGQALGQKNTVFSIWMGYTFMTPVTSLAGGFYSIWHNVYNTIQLSQRRKELDSESAGAKA